MHVSSNNVASLKKFEHLHAPEGFVKIRYLGSGAWKVAFQASSSGSIVDVALLCYHGTGTKNIAEDASKLIRLRGEDEFSSYIARVYNIYLEDYPNVWIAEELLSSPLDSLSPLINTRKFCEISRDLCRGLTFIHGKDLVHRDLKLDNCGFNDQSQIAKIFDVGSVTSEPGGSVCTILTRAPEFFLDNDASNSGLQYRKEADVWGLGAMLFALRAGDYPFVFADEVKERSRLGELLAMQEIDQEEYITLKADLDRKVAERITDQSAERNLHKRLNDHFKEGALRLMKEMLSFDPVVRRAARDYQREWSDLADNFTKPTLRTHADDPKSAIIEFLTAVKMGQLVATLPQIESCAGRLHDFRRDMSPSEKRSTSELVSEVKDHVRRLWASEQTATLSVSSECFGGACAGVAGSALSPHSP